MRDHSRDRHGVHRSPDTHVRNPRVEQSTASIAEEAIRRDLEGDRHHGDNHYSEGMADRASIDQPTLGPHSMAGFRRRPSYNAAGPRPFLGLQPDEIVIPVEQERNAAIDEERALLEDNKIIPARRFSNRRESHGSMRSRRSLLARASFGRLARSPSISRTTTNRSNAGDGAEPSETTALLHNVPNLDIEASAGANEDAAAIDKKWGEAVDAGDIHTTWQREVKTIAKYSGPLMLTFMLQTSLTFTSIVTIGHIGQTELGGVSLGSMTANITGYSIFYGLTTSLDTLCAQAYGSGKKSLVGLQFQRMVYFLWVITIPIATVWLLAPKVLRLVVPEREIAELAGLYLRILIPGVPAYAMFESGKRYVQAQGRFEATLYVLLIAAPLNAFMHWLFVWHFQWGFIGCPISVVITNNLMPLLLFIYVRLFIGLDCWPGFTRKALQNWWPMVRLAIPGLIMVMCEFLAFEILLLAAARFSATHLATQTLLENISIFTYTIPFPVAIAASTRIANLIGASLPDAAKTTARVAYIAAATIGTFNMILLSTLRNYIPYLFSSDADVIELTSRTMPVNAAFQLFDALAAVANGVLRGLGKQEFGGYVSLLAFYVIGIPISFGTAFGLHWELYGLWAGPATALLIVSIVTGTYVTRTSWQKASEEAARRNAAD